MNLMIQSFFSIEFKIQLGGKKMERLFVYGTLMKGQRAHDLLENSKYLGKAILKGYRKMDLIYYPGIVKDKNSIVEGEVYEVDEHTKQRVDLYEGEGYLFKCIDAEINLNNSPIKAKVYEYIVR